MYITSGLEQSQVDRFRHGFVASVVGMKVVAANEAKRQAVNVWIRTSGEYDGVIDFDEATRDFSAPSWLRRIYDSKTVHSVKSTRTYDPEFRQSSFQHLFHILWILVTDGAASAW